MLASYHVRIKELPASEQPRERLRDSGPTALSDAELLAILLRTGVTGVNVVELARNLLMEHGGWVGLQRLSFEELTKVHGMGEAKAAQVKAALEIGRRLLLVQPEQRSLITCPADVANLLMLEMAHLEQEHLRAVLLNTTTHPTLDPTTSPQQTPQDSCGGERFAYNRAAFQPTPECPRFGIAEDSVCVLRRTLPDAKNHQSTPHRHYTPRRTDSVELARGALLKR